MRSRGACDLTIREGRRGTWNIETGERLDLGPVFIVYRPLMFAGQDIGEPVVEFYTLAEAEAFIQQQGGA